MDDCYRLLCLPYGASGEQIKKKFRELAKKYHPDNSLSGNESIFRKIYSAYQLLSVTETREQYDRQYLRTFHPEQFEVVIPAERVLFPGSMPVLAKKGLLRKGYRTSDRKKVTGVNYDFCILVTRDESIKRVGVDLPLTVRVMCPACYGSDLYCGSCGGKGNYKGFRFLKVFFEPEIIGNNKIYEFDLSRFRPDKLVHFKKKTVKVLLKVG